MDHLKAVEGLLAFHHAEIERLEVAHKVLLEIDRRDIESKTAARPKSGGGGGHPKKRIAAKKANGHAVAEAPSRSTAKSKIVALLGTERDLTSAIIMDKIGMDGTPQAKQRVYTALHDLKRGGQIAVDGQHQYRLVAAG